MMAYHNLGRLAPPDFDHVTKYPHQLRRAIKMAERNIPFSSEWRRFYDQGNTPECVAFSSCEERTSYVRRKFDPHWLYAECKKRDGYPNEDGTFMRVAFDVLREQGLKPWPNGVVGSQFKIARNEWLTSVDDMRQALATSQSGILFGTNWYNAMFDPVYRQSHYRLPEATAPLGALAGGHQYWLKGVSDRLGGFILPNSWGLADRHWEPGERGWPITIMPYSLAERLLKEDGEAGIVVMA